MQNRYNNLFFFKSAPNSAPAASATAASSLTRFNLTAVGTGSGKILIEAYQALQQQFDQLTPVNQEEFNIQIKIVERQLEHLLKQSSKKVGSAGYPATDLLKEIRLLSNQITELGIKSAQPIAVLH